MDVAREDDLAPLAYTAQHSLYSWRLRFCDSSTMIQDLARLLPLMWPIDSRQRTSAAIRYSMVIFWLFRDSGAKLSKMDCTHGSILSSLLPGKKPMSCLPHGHDGLGDDDPGEKAVFEGLVETDRKGKECLARPCLADERDRLDGVLRQKLYGELLLFIARLHAPERGPRVIDLAQLFVPGYGEAGGAVWRSQEGALVFEHPAAAAPERIEAQLACLVQAVEVGRRYSERRLAGVDGRCVHPVRLVILRLYAKGKRLDPCVYIFRDENRVAVASLFVKPGEGDDLIVRVLRAVFQDQGEAPFFRPLQRGGVELEPVLAGDGGLACPFNCFAEEADRLPCVLSRMVEPFLEAVELLQRFEGYHDFVFFKPEHAFRIVNENIGVEDVSLPGHIVIS